MPRPRKKINPDRVASLAAMNMSVEEIAADQDCHKRTIERRFAAAIEKGRDLCALSLKAKQFQVAMGRPATPDQYLREKQDEHGRQIGALVLDKNGNPIKIADGSPEWKPNVTMLIWLGKQYAGQSDKLNLATGDGFDIGPPSGGKR